MLLHPFTPPLLAHRGASAYAPENTMAAFTKAAQLGIQWVECDVKLLQEGQLILFHDDELARTTNGVGHVTDFSYHYLRTLDAGGWFAPKFASEPIPTLAMLLDFLLNMRMAANLELHAPLEESLASRARVVEHVLALLTQYPQLFPERLLLSSFDMPLLQQLRKQSNIAQIGTLFACWQSEAIAITQELGCVTIHVPETILSPRRIDHIKQAIDLPILAYTVDDPRRAQILFDWGVTALFTNVPDKLVSICPVNNNKE